MYSIFAVQVKPNEIWGECPISEVQALEKSMCSNYQLNGFSFVSVVFVFGFARFCAWASTVIMMPCQSQSDFKYFSNSLTAHSIYPMPNAMQCTKQVLHHIALLFICARCVPAPLCRLLKAAVVSAGNCTPSALLFKFSLFQSTFLVDVKRACIFVHHVVDRLANASTR